MSTRVDQPRTPAGSPQGGQFATNPGGGEATVSLVRRRVDGPGDRFVSPEGPATVMMIHEAHAGAHAPGTLMVVYKPDGYASARTLEVGPYGRLPEAVDEVDDPHR